MALNTGKLSPSLEELKNIIEETKKSNNGKLDGNVIAVTQQLSADFDTPVTAYLKVI